MGTAPLDGRTGRNRLGLATRLAAVSTVLLLAGCAQMGSLDGEAPKVADIATSSAGPRSQSELEKATAYWGEQHSKHPRDAKTALSYARNLKALGRKKQALAVLQASYMFAPDDREFLSEYGRLALDQGQVSTAGELLARADDPGKPDWRIVSARGTVQAKQGNYKEAIELYEQARELAPDQASVLNNLAMAYTMDGQAGRGEELLRQARAAKGASDDPRVAQNLDLVLGLQGKPVEGAGAVAVAATEPPPALRAVQSEATPAPTRAAARASAPAKGKAAANVATAATGGQLDPDQIIRAAMEAEAAKTAASAPKR